MTDIDYGALADKAAIDHQRANERYQQAKADSETAALRELVFTAASYGVTRLMLEPSDQGSHMYLSEIEPEVESEAEDIIGDAGVSDLSDYTWSDWVAYDGVEVEQFSHRDDQIQRASIDVKVAAEALIAATATTDLRVEAVMFGNDRLDDLDGWQGDAWAITKGDDVVSLHLDKPTV